MKRRKRNKHNWKPLPMPFKVTVNGEVRIYVVEYCEKTGMYQYVRVPSNKLRQRMENEGE
jgi:hypothetical protein